MNNRTQFSCSECECLTLLGTYMRNPVMKFVNLKDEYIWFSRYGIKSPENFNKVPVLQQEDNF